MAGVFEADPEGWREMNAGRPAPHLIRELVQNVFDEKATALTVDLTHEPGIGVRYSVADNVPGGIRDEKLIWTIWMSDKQDTPTKRGRMGRGLKELISVSDSCLIVTEAAKAIEFARVRGKWSRTQPIKKRPKAGTVVEGLVKLWGAKDLKEIVAYLRRMRPPDGLEFTVNGQPVARRAATEKYDMKLPTVVFTTEDAGRVARERSADTTVELFAEEQPWVYEMGIPVEPIEFPVSIDVGQRVPLREKRDTLTDSFRRELFAKLLDRRMAAGLVRDDQLRDNHVLIAAQDAYHLSPAAKLRIANHWTEGKPFASTPADFSSATGQHIPAMPLRGLPQAIREITREVGVNVRDTIAAMNSVACGVITPAQQTNQQRRFVICWEWLADAIGRTCQVMIMTGKPSAVASFSRPTTPGAVGVLRVYADNFSDEKFGEPYGAKALSDLIHELSHWTSHGDEHGSGFTSDAEDVGAQVAAVLFRQQDTAWRLSVGMEPLDPETTPKA